MSVGAVTGLAAEAALARGLGLEAAAGAGTAAGTEAAIASLLARPLLGLISFGIAGGLAPGIKTATLLLPAAVRAEDGSAYWVDITWHARLAAIARAAGLDLTVGGVLGADRIAATAARKAELFAATNAVAVDLESHIVGAAAARARLPFVILRAVVDPAERDLPPAALLPLRRGGKPDLLRVLSSVAARPGQIPGLLRLAGETKRALGALGAAGRALGAALQRP
jgi:hypothetical protein